MADEELMKEIEKVDKRLARLEVTVATEFQTIGKSFRGMHKRFDRLEAAFKVQDDRITGVENRLGGRIGSLEQTVNEGFRDIATRIETLGSRRARRGRRQ